MRRLMLKKSERRPNKDAVNETQLLSLQRNRFDGPCFPHNFIDIPKTLTDTSAPRNLYLSCCQTEDLMPPDVKKVKALQLNLEGLFRLAGGSAEDKQRFLEMIIGITTPIEVRLINGQVSAMAAHAKAIQAGAKALQTTAQQIARRG